MYSIVYFLVIMFFVTFAWYKIVKLGARGEGGLQLSLIKNLVLLVIITPKT